VLKSNQNSVFSIQLKADPRRWLPNGVVSTIDEQVTVPVTVPAGTYELYLYLPDAYPSIASNPAYAIRFANEGVWEASTGMNKLNATVTVTESQNPEGLQQPVEGKQGQTFDVLGRPVDADSYQGVVIRNGQKTMHVGQ
jgi:hypothetical protein